MDIVGEYHTAPTQDHDLLDSHVPLSLAMHFRRIGDPPVSADDDLHYPTVLMSTPSHQQGAKLG